MQLFRKIAQGRRREVPLRLFRILDKRFHYGPTTKFDLRRLCIGTLGLCSSYSPSQMVRVLDRAVKCLQDCDYLEEMWFNGAGKGIEVHFRRRPETPRRTRRALSDSAAEPRKLDSAPAADALKCWVASQSLSRLMQLEAEALEQGFGSELERRIIEAERERGAAIADGGRIRQEYLRRFAETSEPRKLAISG